LQFYDSPLLDAISAASIPRMSLKSGSYKIQEVSNLSWACATLHFWNGPLMTALAAESLTTLSDFGAQELANTSWAWAVLL